MYDQYSLSSDIYIFLCAWVSFLTYAFYIIPRVSNIANMFCCLAALVELIFLTYSVTYLKLMYSENLVIVLFV